MDIQSRKVYVLGLDGGTWDLLSPLMEQGHMPSLAGICREGVSGPLQSTTPPYTAPAWVSCVTGVNPGKHGVFGFTQRFNGALKKSFVSRLDVKVPQIWHYVNESGRSAGMINVPVTYPVEELNGFMIPCFLTPDGKEDYTWPPSLYREIIREVGAYVINVKIGERRINDEEKLDQFIEDLTFATQKRFEAMKFLWSKYSPEFFMTVFTCMDKIQHKFWKFLDHRNPLYHSSIAEKVRNKLIPLYRLVDEIIGYVKGRIDANTTLYIVSDHGFGSLDKRVYLNSWLAKEGFLSLQKTSLLTSKLMSKLHLARSPLGNRNIALANNVTEQYINYPDTLFFCSDVYEQGIYFNHQMEKGVKKQSDYEDQRKLLSEKLLLLKDPETNERFVDVTLFRENIYNGPYVNQAPDILFRMKDYGYLMATSIPVRKRNFIQTVKGTEGCHRTEGIFAVYGIDIVKNTKIQASIMDITPTVLYNMGIGVPKEMDGKVLQEVFDPEFQRNAVINYVDTSSGQVVRNEMKVEYSANEAMEIEKRLKDLGYFD